MEQEQQRIEQFKEEIAGLGLRAPGDATERPWFVGGVALVVAAAVAIFIGWWGASGTSDPSQQSPYLISGGSLGVALAAIGGALIVRSTMARYLRFWFIRMVYEERMQTDRTVEALARIEAALGGSAASTAPQGERAGQTS